MIKEREKMYLIFSDPYHNNYLIQGFKLNSRNILYLTKYKLHEYESFEMPYQAKLPLLVKQKIKILPKIFIVLFQNGEIRNIHIFIFP